MELRARFYARNPPIQRRAGRRNSTSQSFDPLCQGCRGFQFRPEQIVIRAIVSWMAAFQADRYGDLQATLFMRCDPGILSLALAGKTLAVEGLTAKPGFASALRECHLTSLFEYSFAT